MKICALGDSIFAGYLVGGKSLVYFLQEDGYDIDNYGVNGLSSSELLLAIDNLFKYDKYIIHIGFNDFLDNNSVKSVFNNIKKIIEKLKKLGGEIYIISPYKTSAKNIDNAFLSFMSFKSINLKVEEFNEILETNKEKLGYKIISFYKYSLENNIEDDLIDGIHPNKKLHKELSNVVKEALDGYIW